MNREWLAAFLRAKLATNREVFVVDPLDFDPSIAALKSAADTASKLVSAPTLRLLLDYCENPNWWHMSFEEYAAAIFYGREPQEKELLFDLLPEALDRISADRLGLGHIYRE